jgi:spermidine synthase
MRAPHRLLALHATLAILVCAPNLPAGAQVPDRAHLIHSEKSLYRQVLVYEDNTNRCLCFTHDCKIGRQSCIDLKAPEHLVFEYTQMMLGSLFLTPDPQHILVIGLGGGTLPLTLEKLLPHADIDTVEIDPAVVLVAQRYFGFQTEARLHVFEQDGRAYVRQAIRAGKHYDLIMLDAYDNQYIPEHLLTREFLGEVKLLLAPDGVVAANTFSQSKLYSNESVTYRSVFGTFYNVKSGNRVILGTNGPLPPIETVTRNSQRFSDAFDSFGISRQWLLERFSTQSDWDRTARILTDQYSPANLLNSPVP